MRATAPHSHGASRRLPASRSCSIDARISAGRVSSEGAAASRRNRPAALTPRARARRPGLAHRLLEHPAQVGSARTTPSGERDSAVVPLTADQEHELLPVDERDVVGHLGVDAGFLAGSEECLGRGPLRRQHRPEAQPRHRAGVLDHAGRADARADVGGAAHDRARGPRPFPAARSTRRRSGTESRPRSARCGRICSAAPSVSQSLTANITTSAGRPRADPGTPAPSTARRRARSSTLKPLRAHRLEMPAARDEADFVARPAARRAPK